MKKLLILLTLILLFILPSIFAGSKENKEEDEAFWEVYNYHMKAMEESSEKAKAI